MFITRFLHFRKITNLEILASIIRIQIYLKPDNAQPVDNLQKFFKIAKSTFERTKSRPPVSSSFSIFSIQPRYSHRYRYRSKKGAEISLEAGGKW